MSTGAAAPLHHVALVLIENEYVYLHYGVPRASDFYVSKLFGQTEAKTQRVGDSTYVAFLDENDLAEKSYSVCFGACLVDGVAGGRPGIRFAHAVIAEGTVAPSVLEEALRSAYQDGLVPFATQLYGAKLEHESARDALGESVARIDQSIASEHASLQPTKSDQTRDVLRHERRRLKARAWQMTVLTSVVAALLGCVVGYYLGIRAAQPTSGTEKANPTHSKLPHKGTTKRAPTKPKKATTSTTK